LFHGSRNALQQISALLELRTVRDSIDVNLISAQETDDDALTMEARRELRGERGSRGSIAFVTGRCGDQLEHRVQPRFGGLLSINLIAHKQQLDAGGAPVQLTQSSL